MSTTIAPHNHQKTNCNYIFETIDKISDLNTLKKNTSKLPDDFYKIQYPKCFDKSDAGFCIFKNISFMLIMLLYYFYVFVRHKGGQMAHRGSKYLFEKMNVDPLPARIFLF